MPDPTRPPLRRRRPLRRAAATLAAAAALALLPALPAAAHDELVGADPASGATVRALTEVRLTFAEPLVELGGRRNGIVVLDAAGRHHETACATLDGDDLVAPVTLGAAGEYRVQWRGVSDDGHVVGSTYAFTYAPTAATAAASGSATGPACGATASSAAPAATGGVPALGLAIGAGVLLAALITVLVTVLRLRRRSRAES